MAHMIITLTPFASLSCAVERHVMPSKQKMFEAHMRIEYYFGNSREHYRCHEIWIMDNKRVRVGQTAFFKYKDLTQLAVTATDAILRAANGRTHVLKGRQAVKSETRAAVDLLIDLFQECWRRQHIPNGHPSRRYGQGGRQQGQFRI